MDYLFQPSYLSVQLRGRDAGRRQEKSRCHLQVHLYEITPQIGATTERCVSFLPLGWDTWVTFLNYIISAPAPAELHGEADLAGTAEALCTKEQLQRERRRLCGKGSIWRTRGVNTPVWDRQHSYLLQQALHQRHSDVWFGWLGSCVATSSIFIAALGSTQWWASHDRRNRAAGFIYRRAFSASPLWELWRAASAAW